MRRWPAGKTKKMHPRNRLGRDRPSKRWWMAAMSRKTSGSRAPPGRSCLTEDSGDDMLAMSTREFVLLQVGMDVALALLVLFLFWQVRRLVGRKQARPDEKEVQALRQLVEDSRSATDQFLAAVQESKATLKDLARALDEREKRIRELLSLYPEAPERQEAEAAPPPAGDPRAAQVLALAARGLSEREIARHTGIPDGEVHLILNLTGKR